MPPVLSAPPRSPVWAITEVLHGISVTDPYRWLEDQDAPQTRAWIEEQTRYARAYLDSITGRERIRQRIRDLLAVETHDSLQKVGHRYFFRKRLPEQEQPCIYMREDADGEDQLLIDPAARDTGPFTAVKPLSVSRDGRLLLYEVKQSGERTGTFEIFDIDARKRISDALPRGYLRGFAFAPDGRSFYYVHEALDSKRPFYRAAYRHVIGTRFSDDTEVFCAGEDKTLRLSQISDAQRLGFLVCRFLEKTYTDFYLQPFGSHEAPVCVLRNAAYLFGPWLIDGGRLLALTDYQAPNFRIVELQNGEGEESGFADLVPESDSRINEWVVAGDHLYVSYIHQTQTRIEIFDLKGQKEKKSERIGELPTDDHESVRLLGASTSGDEVFLEAESFTEPIGIFRYSPHQGQRKLWARNRVAFDASSLNQRQVWYPSKDGTPVPLFLFARIDVLEGGIHPVIMTAYGGYGISMTPQFSVFVTFLVERGCLFALPNIRGGSEFGAEWHNAAKRRNRQVAFDDFLCAAEWLIANGWTTSDRLAIFGGSNSGLLVGAALTQRPELFRAVVCIVPLLDMVRYHLFDDAASGKEEFGSADDPADFPALLGYSPYHQVRDGAAYPATMMISGDSDQKCNPLHARKMTARLQAANASERPIFLDYSKFRGHSPVLPLQVRVDALTDRMAFLSDQLQLQ
jgi:prolyl oligopeptidase